MQDSKIDTCENERLQLQDALDSERSPEERNKWGQFATPPALADDIMRYALSLCDEEPVSFLEPSSGSGSFISALYRNLSESGQAESVSGIELDPRFAEVARNLWGPFGAEIFEGDFLTENPVADGSVSLLVANPPYSRHHHLSSDQKAVYRVEAERHLGITPSGLSGLYLYFILRAHQYLKEGAISAWLIPSEFLDVNFGRELKHYLKEKVTLRRIHRFEPDDEKFADAMVTSSVVVFENRVPSGDEAIELTSGGTVTAPARMVALSRDDLPFEAKWTPAFSGKSIIRDVAVPRFDSFFKIRRGIATGGNKFFVLPREKIEELGIWSANVVPMMPASRYLKSNVVETDRDGFPSNVPQLGLLSTQATEDTIEDVDPRLAGYFASASETVRNGYLVRSRNPWYKQEHRDPAPFLLTYMGRSRDVEAKPFRFILNKSKAIATNGYLMIYPIGPLQAALDRELTTLEDIHEVLLSITADDLRDGGRVYGGGLHKVEPKELAAMDASAIASLIPGYEAPVTPAPLF